jgi:hypothetical protein
MSSVTRLLIGADVHTLAAPAAPAASAAEGVADAIAWRDGRILAVGRRTEVEQAAGPGAEVTDVAGAAVLPGFVDAHHHPGIVALYGGLLRLAPPTVSDVASLQRAIAGASAALEPGRWLVATDWDEALLAERRAPTRQELDDAVPDRPAFLLHYSCHRAVANSRALELAGIGRDTPDPSGGAIARGRGGLPDGLLLERGMSRVESRARASLVAADVEGFLARLAQHYAALAAAGITRVVDCTVPGDLAALYREAARRGQMLVPTVMMPVSTTGYLEAPWDVLDGPVTGEEAGPLSVGPIKLVLDGAPACAMCLGWWQAAGAVVRTWALALRRGSLDPMRAAMSLQPRLGRAIRTGIRIYAPAEARDLVQAAAERGFAVAAHAIGNEAVETALAAFEAAGPTLARAGAPRLEHATFLSRALVTRIADAGAAVVTQPHFLTLPAFSSAATIPGLRQMPLRWLLDAGVKVAGSSDFPVAGFAPLDGIRAAVHRRTGRGEPHEPDQRVALHEAIAMYTRTAAEVCGWLDRSGTLEAGKRADLVVLDRALRTPADLDGARVRETIIGGARVFVA